MAHKKSKKVFWCHEVQHTIMASYCNHCELDSEWFSMWEEDCPRGNYFNSCRIISENNKKDIDNAWK